MFNLISGALRFGLAGGMALGLAGVVSPDTVLARSTLCQADGQPACRASDLARLRLSVAAGRESLTALTEFAGAVTDAGLIARSRLEAAAATVTPLEDAK